MEGETPLKPGTTLDRYELLCPVGSGGMASVWLARMRGKRGFEKLFAIKTIRAELSDDPRFEEMFLDEARIASGIQHPNVAQVIDLGEQDGILFTVIEWVDGESLARVQKHAAKAGARLSYGLALRIVADACAGLHAAHELRDATGSPLGIVHRDVSPHNILISVAGGVKVIDFGLAKAQNRLAPRTQSGLLKGKLEYMAPEQVLAQEVDRRADVWAMGVCLYELISGHLPFLAENQLELARRIASEDAPQIRGVPEPIRELLADALARDPDQRFESAAAMRKRCELMLSAMELPSTSEDIAAFVAIHLAERAKKRAEIVARALDESIGRGGSIPPGQRTSSTPLLPRIPRMEGDSTPPPPPGLRVSARAMLEETNDRASSAPGGSLAGSVTRAIGKPRPAWVLPFVGAVVGLSIAGVARWRASAGDSVQDAHIAAAGSIASTSPGGSAVTPSPSASAVPSGTSSSSAKTALELPSTSASGPLNATRPTSSKSEGGSSHAGAGTAPRSAPSGSASAAPTATWGLIPPTTPTIWRAPGERDAGS